MVYEVGEQLGVALGLHRAAHHVEGRPEGAVFRGEAEDNDVEGCSQATAPRVPNTVERPRRWDALPVGFSSPSPVCNSLHSLSGSRKGIVGRRNESYIGG